MRGIPLRCLYLLALAALLGGCAATDPRPGDPFLRGGDLEHAISSYVEDELTRPKDPEVKRNLGVAYFRAGRHAQAEVKLLQARALAPADLHVVFFLAENYEALGNTRLALDSYLTYLAKGGKNTAAVRVRIEDLIRQEAIRDARRAIAQEDSVSAVELPENALVVPEFTNVAGTQTLQPLSRGLAAIVTTDLQKVRHFRVLERARLGVLLEEIALAEPTSNGATGGGAGTPTTGAAPPDLPRLRVNPETAPHIGHLLGARRFVQGAFTPLGNELIQLQAEVVAAVEGTSTAAGDPVSGQLTDVLRLEKRLVYQTLATLGVVPTPEERLELDRLPTQSFLAFLAYCQGVDYEETGKLDRALEAYGRAVREDSGFTLARLAKEELEHGRRPYEGQVRAVIEEITDQPGGGDLSDILDDIAISVGSGPSPDTGSDPDSNDDQPSGDPDVSPSDPDKLDPVRGLPDFPPPPPGVRR